MTTDSPWYIKILLAFSGWLAAIFIMLFVGFALEAFIREGIALAMVGLTLMVVAYALLKQIKHEFVIHLALAVSLAGQALIAWVSLDNSTSPEAALAIIALVEFAAALLLPNYIHRLLASCAGAIAFSYALGGVGWPYLADAVLLAMVGWLWLNEFKYPQHNGLVRAMAYGITLAMIPLKGSALFGYGSMTWQQQSADKAWWLPGWIGEFMLGLVFIAIVWQLLQRQGQRWPGPAFVLALAGSLMLCGISLFAPGVTIGMAVLLLGCYGGNQVLTAIGVLALLFYSSSWYYQTDITLLQKAGVLAITGTALLMARLLTHGLLRQAE